MDFLVSLCSMIETKINKLDRIFLSIEESKKSFLEKLNKKEKEVVKNENDNINTKECMEV